MDRGFSSYFERLEINRAFAYLHLIGKRRGRSSPMRDPFTTRFLHLDALSVVHHGRLVTYDRESYRVKHALMRGEL